MSDDLAPYLAPTPFIECDEPSIRGFAGDFTSKDGSQVDSAIALFYAVRDEITYKLLSRTDLSAEQLRASAVLARGFGFCIEKAVLYAAALRACSIPCRLRFADVRNHLTTPRLMALMDPDLFIHHGYVELWLGERWVKASPAFDKAMCERHRVRPVEFDGKNDAIFHEYDLKLDKHIEYVRDHGSFADLPYDRIVAAFKETYPKMYCGE